MRNFFSVLRNMSHVTIFCPESCSWWNKSECILRWSETQNKTKKTSVLYPLPSASIQASNRQKRSELIDCFCVVRSFNKEDFPENLRIFSCFSQSESVLLNLLCVFFIFLLLLLLRMLAVNSVLDFFFFFFYSVNSYKDRNFHFENLTEKTE